MSRVCPNCGASLTRSAVSCRDCGSDSKTGWKSTQDVEYESVDLPEEDYEGFLEKEGLAPRRKSVNRFGLLLVGVILVFALILGLVL